MQRDGAEHGMRAKRAIKSGYDASRSRVAASELAASDASLPTVGHAELLKAGSDEAFRDFVADLFAAASGMQAVRRALGDASGLAGSHVAVLLAIRRLSAEPGSRVSVRAIADHLKVAAPHATTEIGKLEEAGLVAKVADDRDSRAVDVQLTAAGRRALDKLAPLVRKVNDVLFAGMDAAEMAHVQRFLQRIITQSSAATAGLKDT